MRQIVLTHALVPLNRLKPGVNRPQSWWDSHPKSSIMKYKMITSIYCDGVKHPLAGYNNDDGTYTINTGNQRLDALLEMDTIKTIILPIKGMSCSSCSRAVERQVNNIDGLISKTVDFETNSGEFTYDVNKLSYHTLIEKINESHYKVDLEGFESSENSNKTIPPCPACGLIGQMVPNTVFRSILMPQKFNKTNFDDSFQICLTPTCSTAYYSAEKDQVLKLSELKRELWFKAGSNRKIICYCNNVDTDQIEKAYKEFRLEQWNDVMRHFRNKVIEKCEVLNPTGLCCKATFDQFETEMQKKVANQ